jgi:glutathione S-transferase
MPWCAIIARKYGKDTIRPRGQKAWALADQWTDWTARPADAANVHSFDQAGALQAPEDADPAAVKAAAKNLEGHVQDCQPRHWQASRG